MTSSTYPRFKAGQKVGNLSASKLQRMANSAQMMDNLTVQGPFLKINKTPTTCNIGLDMPALLNYFNVRIARGAIQVEEVITEDVGVLPTGVWYGDGIDTGDGMIFEMDGDTLAQNPDRHYFTFGNQIVGLGGNKNVIWMAKQTDINEFDTATTVFRIDPVSFNITDEWPLPSLYTTINGIGGDENIVIVAVESVADHFVLHLDPNNNFEQIARIPSTVFAGVGDDISGCGGDSDVTYITSLGSSVVNMYDTASNAFIDSRGIVGQQTLVDCGGDINNMFVAGSNPPKIYRYRVLHISGNTFIDANPLVEITPPRKIPLGFGGGL